jgi:hypothetical protein
MAHFVPSRGTFCAFPWHISLSLFVPCYGTFCAFPWHILCRPVAHKSFSAIAMARQADPALSLGSWRA